jgi:hypothetical protein
MSELDELIADFNAPIIRTAWRRGRVFGGQCKNGHAMTEDNVVIQRLAGRPPSRLCKACRAARKARYAAKGRAVV